MWRSIIKILNSRQFLINLVNEALECLVLLGTEADALLAGLLLARVLVKVVLPDVDVGVALELADLF